MQRTLLLFIAALLVFVCGAYVTTLRSKSPALAPQMSFGGYRAANVRADNDPQYPAVMMRLSADYLVLYSAADGSTRTIMGPPNDLPAAINGTAPAAGYKDQAAPFLAGQTVWFLRTANRLTTDPRSSSLQACQP